MYTAVARARAGSVIDDATQTPKGLSVVSSPVTQIILNDDTLLKAFKPSEVCDRASISQRHLERLIARGEIRPVPSTMGKGKQRLIPALELAKFLYGDAVVVGGV